MTQTHALIIDDNAKNVTVLNQLLLDEGVTSTHVVDVRQLESAIDTLVNLDVIFLDLEMPGISGYDVLEWFQGDARFQSVPIVAYTVHVSEIGPAHQHGFHSFLGKPINPDRFPEQLASILRGEQIWEAAS